MLKCYGTAAVLASGLVAACGGGSSSVDDDQVVEAGVKDEASSFQGLALTLVDAGYSSSALWFNDFASGELRRLTTGESSDPWLATLSGGLYLFNRGAAPNFRRMDLRTGPASAQIKTPSAGFGDPHAALALDQQRVLLAHTIAGKVVLMNPETGAETATDFDFETGAAPFHPEAFHTRTVGATTEIFVLHQGLADDMVTVTDKARVFVLKDDGTTLTAEDLDPSTDKIDGIEVASSNPLAFVTSGSKVLVVGSCTSFVKGDCVAAVEELDLEARTAKLVLDLTATGVIGNGPVLDAGDGQFFAAIVKDGAKLIVKVDPETGSMTTAHEFPAASAGCCGLYVDTSVGTLYVGDYAEGVSPGGSLAPKPATGTVAAITLEGRPYSGLFVDR